MVTRAQPPTSLKQCDGILKKGLVGVGGVYGWGRVVTSLVPLRHRSSEISAGQSKAESKRTHLRVALSALFLLNLVVLIFDLLYIPVSLF